MGGLEGQGQERGGGGCVVLQYVSLGGKTHGDTAPFDTSQSLWGVIEELAGHAALPLPPPAAVTAATVTAATEAAATAEDEETEEAVDVVAARVGAAAAALAALAHSEKSHTHEKNFPSGSAYGERSLTCIRRKEVSPIELALWDSLRISEISIFAGM